MRLLRTLTLALLLPFATSFHLVAAPAQEVAIALAGDLPGDLPRGPAPTELFEVATVVDGDTIHIMRNGVKEKLRLLCVDTEEKLAGNAALSPTKPETLFGQETAEWAKRWFAERSLVDGVMKVGLAFPGGVEQRDIYGRLLCHVVMPDGTDFQVLLVRLGFSPYYTKYGNSVLCHADFVEAQRAAKREQLGIWNPRTNRARTPGEVEVVRPYELLLPWWEARAIAIDAARERHARNPVLNVEADQPEQTRLAAFASEGGATVEVFGLIDRIFEEQDGSATLLLRTGAKDSAVRVRIAKEHRAQFDFDDLRERASGEYIQNYLVFRGSLTPGPRGGYELWLTQSKAVRVAGPEPVLPAVEAAAPAGERSN